HSWLTFLFAVFEGAIQIVAESLTPTRAYPETHLTPTRGVTPCSDAPCGHQATHPANGFRIISKGCQAACYPFRILVCWYLRSWIPSEVAKTLLCSARRCQ